MKMREEKKKKVKEVKELPIVDLRTEFVSRLREMKEDEVMRAIGLLHLWGSCVVRRQDGVPPKGSYGKEGKGAEGGVY